MNTQAGRAASRKGYYVLGCCLHLSIYPRPCISWNVMSLAHRSMLAWPGVAPRWRDVAALSREVPSGGRPPWSLAFPQSEARTHPHQSSELSPGLARASSIHRSVHEILRSVETLPYQSQVGTKRPPVRRSRRPVMSDERVRRRYISRPAGCCRRAERSRKKNTCTTGPDVSFVHGQTQQERTSDSVREGAGENEGVVRLAVWQQQQADGCVDWGLLCVACTWPVPPARPGLATSLLCWTTMDGSIGPFS